MKVGDTVRIIGKDCNHYGNIGTLVSRPYNGFCRVIIGEYSYTFHMNEVELLSAEDALDEITEISQKLGLYD